MTFAPIDFLAQNDLIGALIILFSALVLGMVFNLLLKTIISIFTSKTKTTFDDDLVSAIKKPLFFGIIILGLYYSLTSINLLKPYTDAITKVTIILGIFLIYLLVRRVIKAIVKWYSYEFSPKLRNGQEQKSLSIFRRVFDLVLLLIFIIILLRYLGVNITPIIASLGIGGLAVALALQQTLGDFIAGLSIIGDKSLRIGDYVELDSGGTILGGYIEDISWRTSRIRTLSDNYVIVPNTKLAQSIATDYSFGTKETFVGITLYVSYKNELDKVEKIANKIASDVQNTAEGAVKGYEPRLRFKEFQESNIMAMIYLKVNQFSEQYKVKHEYIKRIKKAFEKNNIEISRPIRFIQLKR